ncbi:MAG: cytochrome c oxidase assembly protein [Rhodocyclaceae bacterium]|jgi:cytochrome c oxidase assembly protein subunit 11|nr:cytochrome c oxidase assembly protein [Rhodocyclaceae bacterium]
MNSETRSDNKRTLTRLVVVAAVMFGFGYALVPFYQKICEVTGINNLLNADDPVRSTQVDTTRRVTIEFDANTHGLPWSFKPGQASVTVHPGELVHVKYLVQNTRDRAVTGQAIPSYGPQLAGQHFRKLDCFCFARQTLGAGEAKEMPVVFVIDPALPKEVNTITLSYTFFEVAGTATATAPEPRKPGV